MSRTMKLIFLIGLVLSLALSACGPAATPTSAPATEAPAPTNAPAVGANVALKVTGAVTNEQAWTEAEVKAMKTLNVESTNSQGQKDTYTGVLINDLLAQAQPNASATTLVFKGDDGSTSEISLEDLKACTDCILSFRSKGGFSTILPGKPGNLQVKGVIEIQVK